MIVTIDGPAGAGKSTVARLLADRLGFQFLDTGAMYRAVAWAVLEAGQELTNQSAVVQVASEIKIRFENDLVYVDAANVTEAIRAREINAAVSEVADNTAVREKLVDQQRQIARLGNYVCEGRDQGTVAFPDAECKVFLTATSNERAQRRFAQMVEKGIDVSFEEVLTD
ncbi:MAG: (d)CMP kinase, partial [Planctomycetota bacterium]